MARSKAKAHATLAVDAGVLPLDPSSWQTVSVALDLSPQQTRIVELLLRGKRDKQIASELGLSMGTVRTYLGRIFLKLGVQDRVELILRIFCVAQSATTRQEGR